MTSGDYLQKKFRAWAQRRPIRLEGSAGDRGKPNYAVNPADNLFEPLSDQARREFEGGAGHELKTKMRALHSSSAMAANLFHYWKQRGLFSEAAKSLDIPSSGIASISFERKYPVIADSRQHGFNEPPHLDVGIDYCQDTHRVGIECKLFEPYGRLTHQKPAKPYLDLSNASDAWCGIPHCHELAEALSNGDAGFHRLGPTQLIRHILGLKYGLTKPHFRLVYLYLDAPGDEAAEHRMEIERFQAITDADGIHFVPTTVQMLIFRMIDLYRNEHGEYIDYLSERYV